MGLLAKVRVPCPARVQATSSPLTGSVNRSPGRIVPDSGRELQAGGHCGVRTWSLHLNSPSSSGARVTKTDTPPGTPKVPPTLGSTCISPHRDPRSRDDSGFSNLLVLLHQAENARYGVQLDAVAHTAMTSRRRRPEPEMSSRRPWLIYHCPGVVFLFAGRTVCNAPGKSASRHGRSHRLGVDRCAGICSRPRTVPVSYATRISRPRLLSSTWTTARPVRSTSAASPMSTSRLVLARVLIRHRPTSSIRPVVACGRTHAHRWQPAPSPRVCGGSPDGSRDRGRRARPACRLAREIRPRDTNRGKSCT
jgi:hypothetical protein